MNLLLLPRPDSTWQTQAPGSKFSRTFPYGVFEFTVANEAQLGVYAVCSLFSPMFQFADQAAALAAAQAALQGLLTSPAPRAVSRRDLLRGALGKETLNDAGRFHPHRSVSPFRSGEPGADRSTRPDAAARVLLGKTPEQVLDMVPLLFTLCGNAQAYAALLACRAALGMAAEPESDAARDMLVQLETLREHAWRILLDWPVLIGLDPDKKALAALLKFDALFKRHLFTDGEAFKLDSRLDIDALQLTRLIDELEALIDAAIFNGRLGDFRTLTCETSCATGCGKTMRCRPVAE